MKILTQEVVRMAMLTAQGLLIPPKASPTRDDLLAAIRRMGYLQIDTIQAVRRSQYLVLWSRLGHYDPSWLDEVHREGQLFEYYAHSLCYLPIEDYPIFRGRMLYDERTGNDWKNWAEAHPEMIDQVQSVILEKGPVSSADFDSKTISTGWGDVKYEKLALQRMFSTGELMVPYRDNFRRYFDLRERVLPDWDDAKALDGDAVRDALLLKTVYALGVAHEDWFAPYYYFLKTGLTDILASFVATGQLIQVQVENWDRPGYVHPDQWGLVEASAAGDLIPSHTTFLSPFDPLVSDRGRALTAFNFDYRMEAYTPVKERQYGYFCLPILHKGCLVGRLDPKAHRKEKRMEIKNLYLEPDVYIDEDLVTSLKSTLEAFTSWHGMRELAITATQIPELQEALL